VRLWEYRESIESGALPELAPLLLLCEPSPTEETVRREVELIRASGLPEEAKADLLALALRIATREFSRDILRAIFREDITRMEQTGIIEDWIAEGEARGEARGREDEARRFAANVLTNRFRTLPAAIAARIEAEDAAWCEQIVDCALEAESLSELNLE
jgi:predicted transposase YdaD